MPAIGHVTRQANGSFKGQLKTLSIRAEVEILPNRRKASDTQPDYRVLAGGVDVGAGWIRTGETSGKDYVSLSLAAPEFGPPPDLRQSRPCRRRGRDQLRAHLEPRRLRPERPRDNRCGAVISVLEIGSKSGESAP